MRIVAILQARLNSTRLPGKILLPLAGKSMLQNIVERVQRATRPNDIVLAVPQVDAPELAPVANGRAWLYSYAGDEADLVGRYCAAACAFGADLIVRIPCDNPCVDPAYIDEAITDYLDGVYTFFSNTTVSVEHNGRWTEVDGVGCEVFSISRLKWLDRITQGQPELREHPHKYFYDRRAYDYDMPDHGIEFGFESADIRLDVNTQADYDFIKTIYDHFGHHRFTTQEVLHALRQRTQKVAS